MIVRVGRELSINFRSDARYMVRLASIHVYYIELNQNEGVNSSVAKG
jgi:hypothetical protein